MKQATKKFLGFFVILAIIIIFLEIALNGPGSDREYLKENLQKLFEFFS